MKLLKEKGGSGVTFKNDHNKYPTTSQQFIKESSTYEKYYKVVKPYFKNLKSIMNLKNIL